MVFDIWHLSLEKTGRDELLGTVMETCMVFICVFLKELVTQRTNCFFLFSASLHSSADFSVIPLSRYVFLLAC